jgi:MFS family permease
MERQQFSRPPDFYRNFTLLLIDYVGFGVAFSFVSITTVMPSFLRELTDSEPVIALISTIFSVGWLLPQLFGTVLLGGRPRLKPFMIASTGTGRALFLVLALATWAGLPSYPGVMLTFLFSSIGVFSILDGFASVAWFDIMARAIPLARRGRLIGAGQVLSGLLGMAAGAAVSAILTSAALPFPNNYALLFLISGLIHVPSVLALSKLHEPEAEVPPDEGRTSVLGLLRQLVSVWRGDIRFRSLTIVRWLTGLIALSNVFYVLHATEELGLSLAVTGGFIAAERVGGIVASLGFGWLSERKGPRPVIWLGMTANMLCPLLALLLHFRVGLPPQSYVLVFFLQGVTNGSWMLGVFNYLLEIAPRGKRPVYIGLSNFLEGFLMPAPWVGGLLLQATSYPALFVVTLVGVTLGALASTRLKDIPKT